jgi:hypothetical protein
MASVPLLSLALTLLTPVGPGLLPAVLRVTSRSEYFYEWNPPDFTRGINLLLLLLLAVGAVPRLRRGKPVAWFDLGLLGLAALWAVYSQRTVPVAACMAAVLAASAVQPWLGSRPPVARRERWFVLSASVAVLITLAVVVPHTADRPRHEPAWLDDSLRALPSGTVLLSDTGLAGYLMWAYPDLDFPMNGYGDTFTEDELERNADIDAVRGGWIEQVRSIHPAFAVLPPGSPLAYNLREAEDWSVVEEGGDLELLAPPSGWYDS